MSSRELNLRGHVTGPMASSQTSSGRLFAVGGLLVLSATAMNELLALALRNWLQVPSRFQPLGAPAVATITVASMIAAVLVFGWVARREPNPRRTFAFFACIALAASWLPDLAIWATQVFPGTTTAGVLALGLLHIPSAILAVGALSAFGLSRK